MAHIYEEDEFDRLASERSNKGAHRRVQRLHPWLIALIAVIVLAPLLGWGIGTIVTAQDAPAASSDTSSDVSSQDSSPSANPSPESESTSTPSQTAAPVETSTAPVEPAPAPQLKRDAKVLILNGSGVRGAAADVQSQVKGDGFTAVSIGNYSKAKPVVTTVYYRSDDFSDSAEKIAEHSGGSTALDESAVGDYDVVVVLR